jgi:hypothetical protein
MPMTTRSRAVLFTVVPLCGACDSTYVMRVVVHGGSHTNDYTWKRTARLARAATPVAWRESQRCDAVEAAFDAEPEWRRAPPGVRLPFARLLAEAPAAWPEIIDRRRVMRSWPWRLGDAGAQSSAPLPGESSSGKVGAGCVGCLAGRNISRGGEPSTHLRVREIPGGASPSRQHAGRGANEPRQRHPRRQPGILDQSAGLQQLPAGPRRDPLESTAACQRLTTSPLAKSTPGTSPRRFLLSAGCQPRRSEANRAGPRRSEAGSRFPSQVCIFPRKPA